MEAPRFVVPLLGGTIIGISASLLLLLKGRIFGVSGIIAGTLIPRPSEFLWRLAAIMGLLTAGIVSYYALPNAFSSLNNSFSLRYVIAGLLVGFGTQLGSGCTSGHGVCGISRLSPRSILATVTFIISGMVTVALMRALGIDL